MFVGRRKGRLVPTMEAARSDQTRRVSRAAAHLVVGVDDTIASTVFGTITAMATIAAYGRAFPDSPWTVEELVASTAVVLWIAHLYTHALSESISERRSLRFSRLRTLARRELGILLAAVPPSIALTLGAVGLFDETASIWLALVVGLVTLALEGTRYARIERLGRTGTLVAVGANVGLGILVVVLKVSVLH
jgi:FtsH-binding integral membrane protein